jgi:hypothetical protein
MPHDHNASPPGDFDFIIGSWRVHHRRLVDRLAGCTEWAEFAGTMTTRKTLGGFGNIEDNFLDLPGGAYRAVALRSFDAASGKWAIWWLDGRFPHQLDVPVIGSFADGVGTFFAEDTFNGRPIKIRFIWTADPERPRWEQAFSPDGGASWETNWVMEFTRADA